MKELMMFSNSKNFGVSTFDQLDLHKAQTESLKLNLTKSSEQYIISLGCILNAYLFRIWTYK